MRFVRELEAWSAPGRMLPSEFGKKLQQAIWDEGIPRDVFLGLSAIPDETDAENLRLAIQAGELTLEDFQSFCEVHKLVADVSVPQSAAQFLEYSNGRCLAWIHLPEEGDPNLLTKLAGLLKAQGFFIVDPDTMSPLA